MAIRRHTPAHIMARRAARFAPHQTVADLRDGHAQAHYDDTTRAARHWSQWYYGGVWQKLRARHRKREPLCRSCGAPGQMVDHVCDHKGDWSLFTDPRNLQTLCHACHNAKTKAKRGPRPIRGSS